MNKQKIKLLSILPLTLILILCQKCKDDSSSVEDSFPTAKGWIIAGRCPEAYEMLVDKGAGQNGSNAGTIKANGNPNNGFGTLVQRCLPGKFLGKRVRMTGFMKSRNVDGWASFWFRVDPKLAFDNGMKIWNDTFKLGTTDWKKYELVLDVPTNAESLVYGIMLSGSGQIWFDNISFEIVDNTVATTGMEIPFLFDEPKNLDFHLTKEKIDSCDIPNLYVADSWICSGYKHESYTMGINVGAGLEGRNAITLKSNGKEKYGSAGLMQTCSPGVYRGKKIKLTGFVKSKSVSSWAGLFFGTDLKENYSYLTSGDFQDKSIEGTMDWKKYEKVLDVPGNAWEIIYGANLTGKGQIWLENISIEIIGDAEISLGKIGLMGIGEADGYRKKKSLPVPFNLDFEK